MKTIKSLTRLALFALGLSALAVGSAFAASNVEGYIQGEVTTTGGEPIQGATVTVSSEATGFSRTLTTNADGEFRFSALNVGTYTITVEESGFKTATQQADVSIGTGTNAYVTLLGTNESAAELGTVTVTGAVISPIDISSTSTALNIGEATIDRIPVARNTTAIALLAPGTTKGDTAFGNLPSISGSSVAENIVYINGLNVTNFRNGLGYSDVPFEMIKEYQVKLGGISAMYGRTTGGVINIVTKSGTNEFQWGAGMYWEPWIDAINGTDPDVFTYVDVALDDYGTPGDTSDDVFAATPGGTLYIDNERDQAETYNVNLWSSGPIIEDTLFYYVIFNVRNEELDDYQAGDLQYVNRTTDTPFWGTKIDWYITDSHILELTAFSDEEDIIVDTYNYTYDGDDEPGVIGSKQGTLTGTRGGINYALKYTGYFSPTFTLSAMIGKNEANRGQLPSDLTAVRVFDERLPAEPLISGFGGGTIDKSFDERTQYRIDAEWALGDHLLSFGYDYEELSAEQSIYYSGPGGGPDAGVPAGLNPIWLINSNSNVSREIYGVSGAFITENSAFYIEDEWQVTDNVFLRLGLRSDTFKSKTPTGETFVELTNQVAPRLGASWDVLGDGSLKLFGSFSRYYLPIALNTNIRGVGGEYFQICEYNNWDGTFNADGTPNVTPANGACTLNGDGQAANPDFFTAKNLEPMYMDEFTLGMKKDLGQGWVFGITAIHRELGETIEDLTLDLSPSGVIFGYPYALGNPGSEIVICEDTPPFDGICAADGSEYVTYPPVVPKPTRTYNAVTFELEKVWNGEWFLNGTYTYGRSYGNYEGWVRSDNGQDDAGITNLFDLPPLTEGAYGDLPNDVRHSIKIRGAWQFAEHWLAGATFFMESGRPVNVFGNYPNNNAGADFADFELANAYRTAYFYQEGVLVPRASKYPRTPVVTSIDLSLQYMTEIGEGDLTLGLDIFNVFNSHNATEVFEQNETDAPLDLTPLNGETVCDNSGNCASFPAGTFGPVYRPHPVDARFGLPTAFQNPRYVRLSATISF